MIDATLALLGGIILGMVESKAGDALWHGLLKIKHTLRKPLKMAFEEAVDEAINAVGESDARAKDALLHLKSEWKTLQVEENARLDRESVNEIFRNRGVPQECCDPLYDRVNEKFLKAFAHVAKKEEDVFIHHVILSLKELQKDSSEREKDMQSLLAFCQNFGINVAEVSKELGRLRKNLLRVERKTDMTREGVQRIERKLQDLTDFLLLNVAGSSMPTMTADMKKELLEHSEKKIGQAENRSASLLARGEYEIISGDFSKARGLLNEALEDAKSRNDEAGVANAYGSLLMLDVYQGDFNEAIAKLNYIIDVSKKSGDISNLGVAFNNLGKVYFKQGDLDKAFNTFVLAQKLIPQKDYDILGIIALNIGEIYASKGNYVEALEKYEESHHALKTAIEQETDRFIKSVAKQNYAGLLCKMAYLDKIKGDYKSALTHYRESIRVSREMKDSLGVISAKGQMAELLYIEGKFTDALHLVQDNLAVAKTLRNEEEIAWTKAEIGRIYLRMDEISLAEVNLKESLDYFTRIGEKHAMLKIAHDLALAYEHKGDLEKARKLHEQNLELSTELGDKLGEAIAKHQLGILYQHDFDSDAARRFYEMLSISIEP